ncbi:MAG TPA: hypothetical protein VIX41_10035 [Acidimicrobiales bacterium]
MGCNCGKKTAYLVTTRDGTTHTVDSLTAAVQLVRRYGGHYQRISK